MKYQNPFLHFKKREYALWISSLIAVSLSYFLSPVASILSWIASLVGVTALILLARGDILGQLFILAFSILYAIVSFEMRYYGEMITYLAMTAPMAVVAAISWLRHPSKSGHNEVKIASLTPLVWCVLSLITVLVTILFYFILAYFNTAQLLVGTLSVTTSFFAASLTFLRSPYYALGYAANDVVLIVLWVLASINAPAYTPMVLCFVTFLVNDLYGFFSWRSMQKRQHAVEKSS